MTKKISVTKIGGAIIDSPERLESFLDSFIAMPGLKILVHGGGREGSRISRRLGVEPIMIDGRRVTSADTLDVVTMVYAGLVNKRTVEIMQSHGCHGALGISGADADLLRAAKREPLNGVDYGYVGDLTPAGVNVEALDSFLAAGLLPVVCPITHNGNGQLLNTNADTVASSIARALALDGNDVTLNMCFEQRGVLAQSGELIKRITPELFARLVADGTVSGGMLPKLENALAVAADGAKVMIKAAEDLSDPEAGTEVTL
ncbi:MAG: acetylglutamate kinase [Muribaculaceae bacterium]|nr:acetylglutamate kinase [Muribaculaceae bacterium]